MLSAATKTYLLIIAVFACLLIFSASVRAETPPADAPAGSTLEQRVAQRKQERSVALDQKTIDRLQSKCTDTQGKIRSIRDSYTTSSNKRNGVYKDVDAKLWIVIGSLKLIDKDTFNLEQQRLELLKQIKTFDNASAQLRQTLDDITAINCKADPAGFKSLVETAKIYNSQVRNSFVSIKTYIVDQIKPTLSALANELKVKASTE